MSYWLKLKSYINKCEMTAVHQDNLFCIVEQCGFDSTVWCFASYKRVSSPNDLLI